MAKQRPVDKCKLCGFVKELCDSHYLPKRLYAFARAKDLKNPNPLMTVNGQLKQISDQYRGYAFCVDCEDRLNKNGEKWVLANIPKDYGHPFPLHEALKPLAPIFIADGLNVYNVAGVKAFDMEKLVYFGMSIFWRGAMHQWKSSAGQEPPKVDLGVFEESIRKFVFGKDPFPDDVVLTLDIWPYEKVLQVSYPGFAAHLPECQRYWFYVPGLLFFIYLGANIQGGMRAFNAYRGIVKVDFKAAELVWNFTKEGIKSQEIGPKMQNMLQEISAIRAPRLIKE